MKNLALFTTLLVSLALLASCGSSGGSDSEEDCGDTVAISPNGMLSGNLEKEDCQMDTLFADITDPSRGDEYLVTLPAMGTLTITMRSAELDAFLVLVNRSASCTTGPSCTTVGDLIAVDDDSGGGVNGFDARIMIDLAAGTYLIIANSFEAQFGAYTLETTF